MARATARVTVAPGPAMALATAARPAPVRILSLICLLTACYFHKLERQQF